MSRKLIKNIFEDIVLGLLLLKISSVSYSKQLSSKSSGFIPSNFKGKGFQLIKGYKIDNSENKILLICNYGGNETIEKECNYSEDLTFISMLSGAKISDKEIVI